MANRFIVLEGLDGSGKTTLAKEIVNRLKAAGVPADYTDGMFPPYNAVRHDVHLNGSAPASYFFYVSAMFCASDKISEMLKTHWVICDRYIYTTNAYHRARGVLSIVSAEKLGLVMPDRAFHITVTPFEIAMERVRRRQLVAPSHNTAIRDQAFASRVTDDFVLMGLEAIDNSSDTPSHAVDKIFDRIKDLLP